MNTSPMCGCMNTSTGSKRVYPAYYVESWGHWFVLRCENKRIARREAIKEFGRLHVQNVRLATKQDVLAYQRQHGTTEETIEE